MISSATSRRVMQRFIACFSIKRCAAGSSIPIVEMSTHLALLTRRISAIFSSMESACSSSLPNLLLALAIQESARASSGRDVGLGSVNTPNGDTFACTSGWMSCATSSRATVRRAAHTSMENRTPGSSGSGEFTITKSYSRTPHARFAALTLETCLTGL